MGAFALFATACTGLELDVATQPEPTAATPRPTVSADPQPTASSVAEDLPSAGSATTPTLSASPLSSPAPPSTARAAVATWISDGDSLDIDFIDGAEPDWAEVRLIGVNAPEGGECMGDQAKDALIDRLGREEVEVKIDRWDEFGRSLGYVWHDGELINLWLVENGLAVARSAFGHEHDALLDEAEGRARAAEVGLWDPRACAQGTDADMSISIAEANFDAEGRDDENPNGEWIDLTNTGSAPVDITGWTIRDESTRHRYVFGPTTLNPGAQLRLRSGCGTDTTTSTGDIEAFWCDPDGTIWSNSGDTAFVRNSQGALIDSVTWASIYDD